MRAALAPPAGSHLALSLRQARQAREVLGRFAPLGMRVLMLVLAASDMMAVTMLLCLRNGRMVLAANETSCSVRRPRCLDH